MNIGPGHLMQLASTYGDESQSLEFLNKVQKTSAQVHLQCALDSGCTGVVPAATAVETWYAERRALIEPDRDDLGKAVGSTENTKLKRRPATEVR